MSQYNPSHNQIPVSFESFQEQIKNYTLNQRFTNFTSVVNALEFAQSEMLLDFYKGFMEEFPFNHTNWNKYAQYVARKDGNDKGLAIFQESILQNGSSVELWNCFCFWVKNAFQEQPQIIKKIAQQAIDSIGYDYYSGTFWEDIINIESQDSGPEQVKIVFDLYYRALHIPMNKYQEVFTNFNSFIQSVTDELRVQQFYEKVFKKQPENLEAADIITAITGHFAQLNQDLEPKQKQKQRFENQLRYSEFDIRAEEDLGVWKEYLIWESYNAENPNIRFLFQKCLIAQSASSEIWLRYFDLIETEQVNLLLLKYSPLFSKIGGLFGLYLIDQLEAKGELDDAIEKLKAMQATNPNNLGYFMRQIYIEFRRQNIKGCNEVFITLESRFANVPDTMAFLMNEKAKMTQEISKDIGSGYQILIQAFKKFNHTRQLLSFILRYIKQNYESELIEKIKSEVIPLLISASKNKKPLRELVVMVNQFTREHCSKIQDIVEVEKLLRSVSFVLGDPEVLAVERAAAKKAAEQAKIAAAAAAEEAAKLKLQQEQEQQEQQQQEQQQQSNGDDQSLLVKRPNPEVAEENGNGQQLQDATTNGENIESIDKQVKIQ